MSKRLVPKLRFPEFEGDGEWEEETVENLVSTITPPAKFPKSHYMINGKFPIIDQSQSYYCGWTDDHDAVISDDLPLIIFGDHTCILKLAIEPFAQGADGIKILKTKSSIKPDFLFQYLQYDRVKQEDYKRHFSILKEKTVLRPNIKTGEQQKIASCLSSLDVIISANSQKLELLKEQKKGLMQNLFPQEGQVAPKYRFPEFENDGEWIETLLGDVASFSSGGTPSKDRPEYWNGTIPWISASSMHTYNIEKSDLNITELAVANGAQIANEGTLLILVRGSMLYNRIPMGISLGKVAFNQDVKALTITDEIDIHFILYELMALEFQILGAVTATGIGAGKLDTNDLKTIAIHFPAFEEQKKIVSCISALNLLITAQAEKVEQLKLHKKGLMQGLFPKMND